MNEAFEFAKLKLEGSYLIKNFNFSDCRGGFEKLFERDAFLSRGIAFSADEVFISTSAKNVIRGLHFQLNQPQTKLVSVLCGRVLDVIVDLRPESMTFGKWLSAELSGQNHHALYIPQGFAHGFAALEDGTIMLYQCEGAYDKETDTGIRFDDPEIGIEWPVAKEAAVCSARDMRLMSLEEYRKNPMKVLGGGGRCDLKYSRVPKLFYAVWKSAVLMKYFIFRVGEYICGGRAWCRYAG